MEKSTHQAFQRAYRIAQRASRAEGRRPGRAASPATEARLNRLLGLAIAMFGVAVASVIAVGLWIS